MHNRFSKGLIAGVAGGIAMNVFNMIEFYVFHTTTMRYLDWAAVMLYGERTQSLWGNIFALITQIIFTSFLGVVFAVMVLIFEDRSYVFKGWYFGTLVWLLIYSVDFLLKLHDLAIIPVKTGISNFLGSSIFGIVLGSVLWLTDTNRIKVTETSARRLTPEPARKTNKK